MRSTSIASFMVLSAALALFAGCNNTTPPRLYATMSWKMRCPDATDFMQGCRMGCTEGMDRLVDNFAGVDGASITCNVTETASSRILNFRIGNSAGQSVTFQNVEVPHDGGPALRGIVRFHEDNDYTGTAGSATPSNAQPCQITNVQFMRDTTTSTGDPMITGQVYCRTMRADADMQICRGLTHEGGVGTATVPAEFTIYGCPGLVLPAP
ncbi:MAG: hypothetical protein K1X94_23150 [Sandaracinaceae bacterium]|nr:hypothetical protein [Sandaracinaceae bacterium]